MNLHDFISSTSQLHPPEEISVYLTSLWHDAKGNWEKAHDVIQEIEDKTASWIHAYLHRKEGDLWNADYWYSKAGRKRQAYRSKKNGRTLALASSPITDR